MGEFLSCFASLLLMTLAPPVVFGLAVWLCQRTFCIFVGEYSGRPLLLAASALSTPLREAGHALGCMLFFHRIEDMCLFNANDPDGELGFVEHSYNPRNPIALLGNLAYALAPIALGLFVVLVIFLSCFRGVIGPFFDEIALLHEGSAGFADYARTTLSLIPAMFESGTASVFSKIIGMVLLVLICLGIHVTPRDLADAFSGFLIYTGIAALASFVLALFDARVVRMVTAGLGGFATAVTALFATVLLAAAVLLTVAAVFFLIRTLFELDRVQSDQ